MCAESICPCVLARDKARNEIFQFYLIRKQHGGIINVPCNGVADLYIKTKEQ